MNEQSTNHTSTVISVSNATVRHLDKILFEKLALKIKKGEHWAILGESGSGKTALLHTLHKEFNITNGFVRHPYLEKKKEELNSADPFFTTRRFIAFIGQQALFKNKENMRNFFYQQRYHSYFAEEAATVRQHLKEERNKIEEAKEIPTLFSFDWILKNLRLETLLDKTLIQLSNGETRRLLIAIALLRQPLLLLTDNPYIGLDTRTRPELNFIFRKIAKKGTTVVMATSSREIPDIITHILVLKDRKIQWSGEAGVYKKQQQKNPSENNWHPDLNLLGRITSLSPKADYSFENALRLENIFVKSSGKVILHGIDWTVKKGEKWTLFGPNGAGKSTLLSIINGDHPQTYSNKVFLFDQKRGTGESLWDIKKKIGFVSPEMHQYFRKQHNVQEVILSGFEDTLGFLNRPATDREKELTGLWLKFLQLEGRENAKLRDLSAGEQRLVLLIRAMIKNPPLLILDEPCQGLDDRQRTHFKKVADILWKDREITVLYVSHYKEDIPSCVDKMLELEDGTVKK